MIEITCTECGHKFRRRSKASPVQCPVCGRTLVLFPAPTPKPRTTPLQNRWKYLLTLVPADIPIQHGVVMVQGAFDLGHYDQKAWSQKRVELLVKKAYMAGKADERAAQLQGRRSPTLIQTAQEVVTRFETDNASVLITQEQYDLAKKWLEIHGQA